MTRGADLNWQRSYAERERLATGSLVFDQHRRANLETPPEEEPLPHPPTTTRRKRR